MTQKRAPSDAGGDLGSQLSAKLNDMDWDARLEEARKRRAEALAGRPPEPERPKLPEANPLELALPPDDMISEESLPEEERRHQPGRFSPPPAEESGDVPDGAVTGPLTQSLARMDTAPDMGASEGSSPEESETPRVRPKAQSAPELLYGSPDEDHRKGVTHINSRRRAQGREDAGLSSLPGPRLRAQTDGGIGDYGLSRDGWVGLRDGQVPPGDTERWVPPSRNIVDRARSSFERIAALRGERTAIVTRSIILTTPEAGGGRGGPHDPTYGDAAFRSLDPRPERQIPQREPATFIAWGLGVLALVALAVAGAPYVQDYLQRATFAPAQDRLEAPEGSAFAGTGAAQAKPVSAPADHAPVSHPSGLQSLPAFLARQEPAVAPGFAPGDGTEAGAGARYNVRIFVPAGAPPGVEARASERILAGPSRVDGLVEVDYRIRSTHTRYFHRQDWAEANRLARALGGDARNFGRSGVAPPRGYIELYVRGTPVGSEE
ncbi:MAG: hypothetical protein AAGB18_00965 [Pseudomonadota bacterium]